MKHFFSQYAGLKREVYILALGKLVTAMGAFVWPLMTFFLTVRLSFSDTRAAMVIATATILSLPAVLLGGKLADRYSRKNIIILFDMASVFLYLLAALLPINTVTAVLIFAAALCQNMEHPAFGALNADFSTPDQREKAYSLSYLGYNLGYVVGAAAAGLLFREHLRLAFVLNGLAVFVSTVLIFLFVDTRNKVTAEQTPQVFRTDYERPVDSSLSVWRVLRDRPVVLYLLVTGCLGCFPGQIMGVLLPLQMNQALPDTGAAIYGYLNSMNGFLVIAFTPIFAYLLKRFTEIPKVSAGISLFVAGMVLFAFADRVWLLFAAMAVFSLGEVIVVLGEKPYSSRRIPASHRGRVGGVTTVLDSVFSSLAQYLTGFVLLLSGSNYRGVWLVFAFCGAAAAAVYALLYPTDRRTFPLLYQKKGHEGHNIQK